MLVSVVPSTQQVRWYVEGALGCWETLDGDTAAHECQRTLRALLSYLGSVDGTLDLPVVVSERTEIPVWLKGVIANAKEGD